MTVTDATSADVDADRVPAVPEPAGRRGWRRRKVQRSETAVTTASRKQTARTIEVAIEPGDPVLDLLRTQTGPVAIEDLPAFSPAVRQMRADGVRLVVPLVAAGELVGLLALGDRLSERGYSRDDRKLLESLARHAAPALRVGQLVRQQEEEARNLQRIESELQVAQLIQQHFLPSQLPTMSGWQVDAFYLPARTVGGDFYDVIALADERIMIVTGDVTDKGVPAALVMASTHALLRAAAQADATPGEVLRRVNDLLHPQIPIHMFVTCLVLIIDPATGATTFANAGHNLPYLCRDGHVSQLSARGMPLGLMPGSSYEEHTAQIEPGDIVVLYSDGITEQHDANGEMFGFDRAARVVASAGSGAALVDQVMDELATFSLGVEQEDDITLVAISRPAASGVNRLRFTVPSATGNEREAMDRVVAFVAEALPPDRLAALGTAVSETAMNAIEHGNKDRVDLPVEVEVVIEEHTVRVGVTDLGGGRPEADIELPDLDLKLAGLQSPRGWGLFLVAELVDSMSETTDASGDRHTVHLQMQRPEGGPS